MSAEIMIQFEVRSMLIMKDTLTAMDINYQEVGTDIIEIERPYHNIKIDGETGRISFDEIHQEDVNQICQTYQVNWYKDRAIKEGNKIREEVNAEGIITLHVLR